MEQSNEAMNESMMSIILMRRKHLTKKHSNPQSPFNNSFHVNQIALPLYNAFNDKYLRQYFSNYRVAKHIQQIQKIQQISPVRNKEEISMVRSKSLKSRSQARINQMLKKQLPKLEAIDFKEDTNGKKLMEIMTERPKKKEERPITSRM